MIPVYVNDIKCSLQNKCYFSALSLALTLPDICGMAEFPDKSVSERYTEWYDKYLGDYMAQGQNELDEDNPWLSGEVIYNLRNTYLHQGSPNVISAKVKEPANQIDKFILVLGDGTQIWDSTININVGYGKLTFKAITVDVSYLCNNLCDCALWYYENNANKFSFDFNVITQEEYMNPPKEVQESAEGDFIAKILNQKLERQDSSVRFAEQRNTMQTIRQGLDIIFSDEEVKNRFLNGNTISFEHSAQAREMVKVVESKPTDKEKPIKEIKGDSPKTKATQKKKTVSKEKREAQVRSFFERHFKKQIYLDKKEEIIQSVLKSRTKLQVNNNLMKHFSSKEVSTIYQRLEPLIKDLPGK